MKRSNRWTSRLYVVAAVGLGIVVNGVSGLRADQYPSLALPRATQAWRSIAGKQLLCVAGDQIWRPGSEFVKVLGVENRGLKTWTIRDEDRLRTWQVSQRADLLRTEIEGQATEYKRLDSVPEDCGFKAVTIGQPHEISREQREAIAREIHERMIKDQEAGKSGIFGPTSGVVIENREYLKKLILDVGWIDLHRFGPEGSGNAIILAQHSEDLSLMIAILPFVEKEYKGTAADPVMYAILYDRLQLNLGRKQRYGTQMGKDSDGNPMVLPLEDASKVEQFRKEIGLPPLAEYLKLASEGLYSGKAIRMPRNDE